MLRLITLLAVLALTACSDPDEPNEGKTSKQDGESNGLVVAVLGADTSQSFVDGLRSKGITKATLSESADVAERARILSSADVAIILVDATQGPMPVNREDILLSRQFCRGPVIIGFSRSALIDDPELLELEELEMRELLNTYDLPGDTAAVCFDSETARTHLPKGFDAIYDLLAKIQAASPQPPSEPTQSVEASVYALSDLESFKRGLARTIGNGTYRLVLGEQVVEAELTATAAVQPASSGAVSISFPSELDLRSDARFVIASQNHVIAAGTVTQIKR